MSLFETCLVIFTGAMGAITLTLVSFLLTVNVFKVGYEKAGPFCFVGSSLFVAVLLSLAGSALTVICMWMSGITLLITAGFLIFLLSRAIKEK